MNVNSVMNIDGTAAVAAAENTARTSETGFSNYMNQASGGYGDYLEQIFQKASDTYQVSKDLLKAMAKAESNFKSDVTSHAGAMGIMQLMPATAASLGVTDAYDPEQNIMGGAKYISQLLERYDGNLSYAVAAYNAGSGNVNKYGGIPPFKETQNYVAKVLQYMQEGVTIPDSSGTVTTSTGQVYGQTQANNSTSGSALQNMMNKYFDYDDYLEFLQLFTRIIYEKITGTKIGTDTASQTDQTSQPLQDAEEEQKEIAQVKPEEPTKQLTMRIKDSNGNVNTYRQGDSANDAYIAYQNMTAGSKNRMAIYLTKTAEQTEL